MSYFYDTRFDPATPHELADDLLLALRWADLHGDDPQQQPGAVPVSHGGDHLVELGGDGTPSVQDLCVAELGIARRTPILPAPSTMADALDLRHRLPQVWLRLQQLECEAWLACKVASMSRDLDRHQVAVVDTAVAAALATEAPSRVLLIAEAKIVEADTAAHTAKVEAERRRRHVSLTRTDDTGLRTLIARLEAADAVWVDATVDRVADRLATDADLRRRHHPDLHADLDGVTKEELRAVAFGWLARPDDLAALLGTDVVRSADTPPEQERPERPRAVVYVHLHQAAVDAHGIGDAAGTGVARVEGIGPMLLEQVIRLLGHAHVKLRPVIDLADQVSVNAYEHPTAVRERVHLRTPGDGFPHAAGLGRRVDLDHCTDYRSGGPPGQTGDHNAGPLGRRAHRAKTHLPYRVTQPSLTSRLWHTPHGLMRIVDHQGTREVDDLEA